MTLTNLGRLAEARVQNERALAMNVELHGPDSPSVAYHHDNIGAIDLGTGKIADARQHFERALAIRQAALAADHPDLGNSFNNVGLVLLQDEQLEPALVKLREAERIFAAGRGTDQEVGRAVMNEGDALRGLGRLAEAHAAHLRAVALWEGVLGKDHVDLAYPLGTLAEDALAARQPAEAITYQLVQDGLRGHRLAWAHRFAFV